VRIFSISRPHHDFIATGETARMSEYRRSFVPGGSYFFTVVSGGRAPLFANDLARRLLGNVMRQCFQRYPVKVVAVVLLPEHLHTIWTLPYADDSYSSRWRWIKREFTRAWLASGGTEPARRPSHRRERRRGVWQRRFWEHLIRDEADMEAHFDYIHYNPVKHGLVRSPCDWPWSSFHRWVAAGHYAANWGSALDESVLPGNAGE
jgi:putative transposase